MRHYIFFLVAHLHKLRLTSVVDASSLSQSLIAAEGTTIAPKEVKVRSEVGRL